MACSGTQSESYIFRVEELTSTHTFFTTNSCVYGVVDFMRTFNRFQCNSPGRSTISVRDDITIRNSSNNIIYSGGYNFNYTRDVNGDTFDFTNVSPGLLRDPTTNTIVVYTDYIYKGVNVRVSFDISGIRRAFTFNCLPPNETPVVVTQTTNRCSSTQAESFEYPISRSSSHTFFTTNSCVDGTIEVTRTILEFRCDFSIKARDDIVLLRNGEEPIIIGSYEVNYNVEDVYYTNVTGNLTVNSSSEIYYTYTYKGELITIYFDNSDITSAVSDCENASLTVRVERSSSSINIPENLGCGPKLRILKEDNNLISVSVFDRGYNYVVIDNKVETVYENSCVYVSSSFTLEIVSNLTDDQIIQYVLSGFVYGTFTYKPKNFLNRLLLSPFRNFASRYQ